MTCVSKKLGVARNFGRNDFLGGEKSDRLLSCLEAVVVVVVAAAAAVVVAAVFVGVVVAAAANVAVFCCCFCCDVAAASFSVGFAAAVV